AEPQAGTPGQDTAGGGEGIGEGVIDGAGGSGDLTAQVVAVREPEIEGDIHCEFRVEDITGAAGMDVQQGAHIQQQAVVVVQPGQIAQVTQGKGLDQLIVTQPSPAVFEIRPGHGHHRPGATPPADGGVHHRVEVAVEFPAPFGKDPVAGVIEELLVAADEPEI